MKNIYLIILTSFLVFSLNAQVAKLEGPRIGFTMVEAGLLANILKKDVAPFNDENTESWEGTSLGKYGAIMSQYGWQWESRFADGSNITGIATENAVILVNDVFQGPILNYNLNENLGITSIQFKKNS